MASLDAIPKGSWILVTGANGYIGSQIVNTLLELGYKVRGSVRSPKPWLEEFFTQKFGQGVYENVIVESFDNFDAIVAAVKGVSGVVHVASDLTFGDDPEAVIPWVVKATQNVLAAAAQNDSVQRVVLTSSSAALINQRPNTPGVVDEQTWNDEAVKLAWDPNTPNKNGFVYSASKVQGEKAAWEFVNEHKPSFVFNSVLPNFNVGEILHPEIRGSSMAWIRGLLSGDTSLSTILPQNYVDVRDTARLHAIALLAPDVISQRLIAMAGSFNMTDVILAFKELRPDNTSIPAPPAEEGQDLTEVLPAPKAEALLKRYFGQKGWTPLRDGLEAGIRGL
ncbi:hypothetical protein ASPWEDRAFT_175347 [Aspergillus wentii DTO 134E9]|uniref:NAD-dependent epimerase/dehydratase domain-containing protein n=1 Tax=Aspergillus wentii DTO 134E9 TaxID=1073089 RepID=A0A1L9RAW0_ASPWE|nr:uncharacterized protein ASPWEDRAFT_175347 [Aspergillus wentii DTO 134E9]KAI9934618.1 hypothetical protein MW887_000234 [Aspergillus wentii]OJJ32040.1 hypothetical protein ASPWEDRAFT_175347 [Aspergillus wentii DTO 134E9]